MSTTESVENAVSDQPSFKVYKPPTLHTNPSKDLPDSYFTPTAADLKAAQSTLAARTSALVNAPLQLRATREASEKAKRDRWPNTTIRIRFTDQTQLEKVFLSTDKIRSVYAFVRSSLREEVRPIKFILYQSPPKRDLKVSDPKVRDLTLSELSLAPSSIIMVRFEDESLNGSQVPAPLAPSIISQAVDLPSPPNFDEETPKEPQSLSPASSSHTAGNKIPKWLMAGLRKN